MLLKFIFRCLEILVKFPSWDTENSPVFSPFFFMNYTLTIPFEQPVICEKSFFCDKRLLMMMGNIFRTLL